ncbi:MAG: co-chaperone GroES [Bryobacteraceae bacterium]|nr:co-chaperone GroES [Bryobacteraceae bacterium]
MNVRPLHDNVLVQRLEENESMIGGIYIPDSAKEKPQQGKVVRVGPGRVRKDGMRNPVEVQEGDRILFGKYGGNEIKIDGQELLILAEHEILAILAD